MSSKELPELSSLVDRNWVSLRQVAALLEVTYQTALRYIKPGEDRNGNPTPPVLKAVRVGGKWRVYEEDLRSFLDSGNR